MFNFSKRKGKQPFGLLENPHLSFLLAKMLAVSGKWMEIGYRWLQI
jgi:hypothetical protein